MLERRKYERVPFLCRVSLVPMPAGAPLAGQSVDLSLGGVGVLTQACLLPGQLLRITFFLNDGSQAPLAEQVMGRVAHLRADEDGNRVGVEFLQPLQEAVHPVLVRQLLRA